MTEILHHPSCSYFDRAPEHHIRDSCSCGISKAIAESPQPVYITEHTGKVGILKEIDELHKENEKLKALLKESTDFIIKRDLALRDAVEALEEVDNWFNSLSDNQECLRRGLKEAEMNWNDATMGIKSFNFTKIKNALVKLKPLMEGK